jgi:hypothetical protein
MNSRIMAHRRTGLAAFAIAAASVVAVACATDSKVARPASETAPGLQLPSPGFSLPRDRNVPVIRYIIEGRTYYYVRSPCCDLVNRLYDEQGRYVCAPDGGFAGRGDGKCQGIRLDPSAGVAVPNPFAKPGD